MKTLVIDAYDSFVYIIVQYLKEMDMNPIVFRNDKISLQKIEELSPDMILLGPGPGHPKDSYYIEIINHFKGEIPILGVCLGHQAIGLAFNSKVTKAKHLMHGKTSIIENDGKSCFKGLKNKFKAMRYHSLVIDNDNVGDELKITATSTDDGYIMGIRHKYYPIEGLQFHPESIGTEEGKLILKNFKDEYVKQRASLRPGRFCDAL
ncbi:anthranilate synthase component II [Clostridium beijerinckii]|uniref:Anthranilate synthase component 2 n=1 Tax=Clostridium beijerinckii TaxID=1520 RepID=A0AAE5LPC1_CLOBE|nr:aminodeoxychorismate/anthranilate synthase component II [Clostridium beijerinckii]NSB13545.1 anthranilate synthase component 2 [Clostridium beijerinckii]OOM26351.1 aminodeoxychorismate/anthranilate synthase component 2 [Clostridium beijerinckii]